MNEIIEIKLGTYVEKETGLKVELIATPEYKDTGIDFAVFLTIERKRYCDNGIEYCMSLYDFLAKYERVQ